MRAERGDRELNNKLHELRMTVQRLQEQTKKLMEFIKVQERTSRAIQQELGTLEEIMAQAHAKNTLLKEQFRLLKEPKEAALRSEDQAAQGDASTMYGTSEGTSEGSSG